MQSRSMVPTLLEGGMALFECFDHAIRGSVIPLSEITIETLRPGIEAGDVVAFHAPGMIESTWTKRIIGLPGDSIEIRDAKLIINGTIVATEPNGSYPTDAGTPPPSSLIRETLANGRSYLILADPPGGPFANMGAVTVPPGSLFVLGDNRPNSMDSRFPSQFGFVPVVNLVARVRTAEATTTPPAAAALAQLWPGEPARIP